jgi:ABC-type dipeptide/oligopeptide/nickel transport system permease subunit
MDGTFLILLHSILRYGLLILVVMAVFFSLYGLITRTPVLIGHRQVTVWAVLLAHIQLVLGIILYIVRGWYKVAVDSRIDRYWKMEHIGIMLVAIILITMGRVLSKRAKDDRKKQIYVAVFFLIALLLMLMMMPWPYREIGFGRGWI